MSFFKCVCFSIAVLFAGASSAQDSEQSLEQEVSKMITHIENEGQFIDVAGTPVHIGVYLMQFGKVNVATELLKKGVIEGFVSFPFEGAYLSDAQVAIVEGHLDYFKALIKRYPDKIDAPIKVSDNGDNVTILGLLSTNQHKDKIFYESLLLSALKAGADPRAEVDKGLSPLVMASSFGNNKFIRIVGNYENSLPNPMTESDFFKNPSLTTAELLDEQGVIDAFIELGSENSSNEISTKALHNLWVKMITKGYNSMADILYNELSTRDDFSIDMRTEKGLSGLIASGMSQVYGGNVDYALKLIKFGTDVHQVIQFGDGEGAYETNVIELALPSDNHKFVALMIKNGVNFLHSPSSKSSLIIDMAIRQKAYRSAFIIKTAIEKQAAGS
tara:strand:- start:22881 stop:24041 length:1161 start_codon:yes stop_codon:yes gene_type:complete